MGAGRANSHDNDDKAQLDKFKDLARELEADEDEERFEEQVRRIAPKTEGPREEPEEGG
ncbi:MAG: hypothetical protein WCY15_12845 [Phenylobacterium sp.]|uniref:hypothetical protein n=1 Tax=Phenylobacterium sp. TaxID=1871053 RepID=UPI00356AA9F9